MLIGKIDKRVQLQKFDKTLKDWVTYATIWAEIRNPDLKTAEIAGTSASEMIREINVRRRSDVGKGCRVLYGTKKFDVLHAYDRAEDKNKTAIVVREVIG